MYTELSSDANLELRSFSCTKHIKVFLNTFLNVTTDKPHTCLSASSGNSQTERLTEIAPFDSQIFRQTHTHPHMPFRKLSSLANSVTTYKKYCH